MVKEEIQSALADQLLAMADDELILGHRDSEWTGHAPILEEDIAFANIALDEIGHANLWYGLYAELLGENSDTYPDQMVFFRQPDTFRNVQLVELPKGDWAFSMLRQYFFDTAELVRLAGLAQSTYTPVAEAAAKIRKEEVYHYRHTSAWVQRLSLGTDESHQRCQKALDEIWPYTAQIFTPLPGESRLAAQGYTPPPEEVQAEWERRVLPFLEKCDLSHPQARGTSARRQEHTGHLKVLVSEMQSVARLDPQAKW